MRKVGKPRTQLPPSGDSSDVMGRHHRGANKTDMHLDVRDNKSSPETSVSRVAVNTVSSTTSTDSVSDLEGFFFSFFSFLCCIFQNFGDKN